MDPNEQTSWGEHTISQLWVMSTTGVLQSIEGGWMENPSLFGDQRSRLWIGYTTDNYADFSYNNDSWFVQTNPNVYLGGGFAQYSTVGGAQVEFHLAVMFDAASAAWWIGSHNLGGGGWIGYLPNWAFNGIPTPGQLYTQAGYVEFGGEVWNYEPGGHHTATHMGSGPFPNGGFGWPWSGWSYAAYIRNIAYYDLNRYYQNATLPGTHVEYPNCYDQWQQSVNDPAYGDTIYFGGPGLNLDCE